MQKQNTAARLTVGDDEIPAADQTADFATAVREQTAIYAGKRKAAAVALISDAAEAIRASGKSFDDQQHLKSFFDSAAAGVDDLATSINNRKLSEVYDEIEDAIRRRPLIAGTAITMAAFVLVRFLKKQGSRPLPRSRTLVSLDPANASHKL